MVSRLAFRKAAAAAILFVCSVASAFAQFASDKVSLYVNWEPSHFGATSGNGCWGYVSASGREYALMGLNNQVAFIEITNPASPVWVTSIPHTSSTWGDIKVYGNYAYAVTETSGTGIQVMDMSQIDLGIVTLVRTITSPGRTHTLALDPDSKKRNRRGWSSMTAWTASRSAGTRCTSSMSTVRMPGAAARNSRSKRPGSVT